MALGGTAAWWLGAKRPIFAALAPLIAMTGDPFAAVSVSLGRIVGVFAGVGLGIAFTHVAVAATLRIGLALLAGTLGSVLLKVGGRPNLEVPIAVASLVWPPDPVRELTRQLERLRHELVLDLAGIADDLATGGDTRERLNTVRKHSRDAVRDVFELDGARRALRWSPLRRRDSSRVEALGGRINLAARAYRHARALRGEDAGDALGRAAAALTGPAEVETLVVAAQLR